MEELQVHMILVLVIACHTRDGCLTAQSCLMQLGIHQHHRIQG